jgi:hypothetical protein
MSESFFGRVLKREERKQQQQSEEFKWKEKFFILSPFSPRPEGEW